MVQSTSDTSVDFVLEQIETMVASEGGTLDVVSMDASSLKIKYTPGVNEECPECVPDHELVEQMFQTSLKTYAPHVKDLELL